MHEEGFVVGAVGSREYPNLEYVDNIVESELQLWVPSEVILVSGGARGVDKTAENAAARLGYRSRSYRPVKRNGEYVIVRYDFFGAQLIQTLELPGRYPTFAKAAFARNTMIVEDSDRVVAFLHGVSTGTMDSIKKALRFGKSLEVFPSGAVRFRYPADARRR